MKPLVSIVIPHFERPGLLREAVASVFASSEQRFEIVIVDDGSREADWQAVSGLAGDRVRVLRREDGQKGPSRCRNLGLAASQADRVIFLDSDDWITPWCLAQRLEKAAEQPEVDCWVFPVLLFQKKPGDQNVLWNAMEDGTDAVIRFARSDPPWHTSSPLWKRAVLLDIGGFNEKVFYGDDTDLHMRALLLGKAPALFPEALPDAFVRRSDAPRITNTLDPALIASRRIRLDEGTRFLKQHPDGAVPLRTWEGQYFVEAEFLLFNQQPATGAISAVLNDWEAAFRPSWLRRLVVRGYFVLALASRRRVYLLLRLARRVAMKFLPADFFPRAGAFHRATAPARVMDAIRDSQGDEASAFPTLPYDILNRG